MKENDTELTGADIFKTSDHRTRSRLLEAAGIVFSEKGFEGATAREICDFAQVNSAAVNYYFGGKKQLYVEVLREAHRRLVNLGALKIAVEDMRAPEEALEGFFTGLLHSMLDPAPDGWIIRVIMREIASQTEALAELVELQIRPTAKLFRTIISRLMDLPVDHEAVVRGTLSTVAQFVFVCLNRHVIELIYPDLDLRGEGIDRMARHIWRFSVAGLRAVARDIEQG
jgi:TetR/AcrR family transcriptional regulator, regulator of cefoperazone and chloramphenicol sensitivity